MSRWVLALAAAVMATAVHDGVRLLEVVGVRGRCMDGQTRGNKGMRVEKIAHTTNSFIKSTLSKTRVRAADIVNQATRDNDKKNPH